jgi:DNA topoisomerase VI subunit B
MATSMGMGEQQQRQAQTIVSATANVPVIHTEPDTLYEETCRRLEHYNTQIEKLNTELKKLTLMRDVLAAAQNAFDRSEKMESARDYPNQPY